MHAICVTQECTQGLCCVRCAGLKWKKLSSAPLILVPLHRRATVWVQPVYSANQPSTDPPLTYHALLSVSHVVSLCWWVSAATSFSSLRLYIYKNKKSFARHLKTSHFGALLKKRLNATTKLLLAAVVRLLQLCNFAPKRLNQLSYLSQLMWKWDMS